MVGPRAVFTVTDHDRRPVPLPTPYVDAPATAWRDWAGDEAHIVTSGARSWAILPERPLDEGGANGVFLVRPSEDGVEVVEVVVDRAGC